MVLSVRHVDPLRNLEWDAQWVVPQPKFSRALSVGQALATVHFLHPSSQWTESDS